MSEKITYLNQSYMQRLGIREKISNQMHEIREALPLLTKEGREEALERYLRLQDEFIQKSNWELECSWR